MMYVLHLLRIIVAFRLHLATAATSLPPAEVEALRDIFRVAQIPWNETRDPCAQFEAHFPDVNCTTGHVTNLDLSAMWLTSLPESIGQLLELGSLTLDNNRLTSLPESIGQLQELGRLILINNQLTSLPESIGQLQKLRDLNLLSNQLTSLPESIGQLQTLNVLILSNNSLTSLPESIGQLQKLSYLELRNNQLKTLNASIGHLQSLTSLDLINNQLTSLPESIGQLQKLLDLDLNNNQLTSLPESIGELQELSHFSLVSNQLTSLSASIGQMQGLWHLALSNNQLTSLPESIGQLEELQRLFVSNNQLTSLPESIGQLQELSFLILENNQLKILPESLGKSEKLSILSLGYNLLECLPEGLTQLRNLKSVLLGSNRLHNPTEMCKFGSSRSVLKTLYFHKNTLQGELPPCLDRFTALQTLTLHQNSLSGGIPRALSSLPELKVVTLHENHFTGSLPQELADAPSLTFFSAYSNYLQGHMPPLNLSKGCVDDESFIFQQQYQCNLVSALPPVCKEPEMARHCPSSCGLCPNTSARGPVLLLHNNRLSCNLPEQVTSWPEDIRAISLIGNMLGNESFALPPWIQNDEQQPFLYLSSNKMMDIFNKTMPYLAILLVCILIFNKLARPQYRHILDAEAGAQLLHRSHIFVLRMCLSLSGVAAVLLMLYASFSTYYECGSSFSSTTLSNFLEASDGGSIFVEWVMAVVWVIWVALGAIFVEKSYPPRNSREAEEMTDMTDVAGHPRKCLDYAWRILCSMLWMCIVIILSFPSIAFAIVNSIPSNNTLRLSSFWLNFWHGQAALVMVLIDTLITPKLVAGFHAATGIRRSMLLMAARLGTMWLAAVLVTFYLSTECMNGWTLFWQVCDENTEDYQRWNISIGDNSLLEPKEDLCRARTSWMTGSACIRSVVDTMAPLLLSKMMTRAFVQPSIALAKWLVSERVSEGQDDRLFLRWRICKKRICTSNSLEHGQQVSLLVTFAEMGLFWGAFVPLLVPAVLLAAGSNMVICKIGHAHFKVTPLTMDKNAPGIARRYLHGTIFILLCFQNWFALSSGMRSSWLLLATAGLYCLYICAFMIRSRRQHSSVDDDTTRELTRSSSLIATT